MIVTCKGTVRLASECYSAHAAVGTLGLRGLGLVGFRVRHVARHAHPADRWKDEPRAQAGSPDEAALRNPDGDAGLMYGF